MSHSPAFVVVRVTVPGQKPRLYQVLRRTNHKYVYHVADLGENGPVDLDTALERREEFQRWKEADRE